jgi:group II intron reverse transcriptase/maturase
MNPQSQSKPFAISKREVKAAWERVRKKGGAGGVDEQGIREFCKNLSGNLYKIWNRMSSGSYQPQAVRRVEIPKKDGTKRALGIPTVSDRVAQEVVRARLEPELERIFHQDSWGYRPGKSAQEAIATSRRRSWEYDWVLDVDIEKFFDTIDHELLMKAVKKHCREKWMVMYVERWLKAPVQFSDGSQERNERGTPQGGVISPLLANLYLHYAFDEWMKRLHPEMKYERYADDIIVHCRTEEEAKQLQQALATRLKECGLNLHPVKTKIVYCKDANRRQDYPNIAYQFLGYTFRPRQARNSKTGRNFTSFLPAASTEAKKALRMKYREVSAAPNRDWTQYISTLNPLIRGWYEYFSKFYSSALKSVTHWLDCRIGRWLQRKYKLNRKRAFCLLRSIRTCQPHLFWHWRHAPSIPGRAG